MGDGRVLPAERFVAIRVPRALREQVQWLAAEEELPMYRVIEELVREEMVRWHRMRDAACGASDRSLPHGMVVLEHAKDPETLLTGSQGPGDPTAESSSGSDPSRVYTRGEKKSKGGGHSRAEAILPWS